jgi:hypothetical protein
MTAALCVKAQACWKRGLGCTLPEVKQESGLSVGADLSGADCSWTTVAGSKAFYIRKNGRAYRLAPAKDRRWDLFRIEEVDDLGKPVGTYGSRGDASKALVKLAYGPEPRW